MTIRQSIIISLFLCGGAVQAASDSEKLIEQWIKTESLIAKEAAQWKVESAKMKELTQLHVKELKLLAEELKTSEAGTAALSQKKQELDKGIAEATKEQQKLIAGVVKLQPRMSRLLEKFPEPLQEQLEAQKELIQEEGKNTPKKVAKSLEAMIQVLQEADRFNSAFTVVEQEVKLEQKQYHAQVLYFGLGRAFFIAGDKAGVGRPTKAGWSWKLDQSLHGDIEKAIKVLAEKRTPSVSKLPIQVEGEVKP